MKLFVHTWTETLPNRKHHSQTMEKLIRNTLPIIKLRGYSTDTYPWFKVSYRKSFIWYLLAGSRGGETRAKIVKALRGRPYNTNQLAKILKLDYKTVRHHLEVLMDNRVIVVTKRRKYGSVYVLSEEMERTFEEFKEIWGKLG